MYDEVTKVFSFKARPNIHKHDGDEKAKDAKDDKKRMKRSRAQVTGYWIQYGHPEPEQQIYPPRGTDACQPLHHLNNLHFLGGLKRLRTA